MNTILIGYDLNKAGRDYEKLVENIKSLGAWWHHLDSTWLVRTSRTVVEVRDALMPHIDTNDELLVIDVTGRDRAWTGFSASGGTWLREKF